MCCDVRGCGVPDLLLHVGQLLLLLLRRGARCILLGGECEWVVLLSRLLGRHGELTTRRSAPLTGLSGALKRGAAEAALRASGGRGTARRGVAGASART